MDPDWHLLASFQIRKDLAKATIDTFLPKFKEAPSSTDTEKRACTKS
jgi:hypothetical protein